MPTRNCTPGSGACSTSTNAMMTGNALSVIKATQHRIDLNARTRPVRFAHRRACHTAREAETADVKR